MVPAEARVVTEATVDHRAAPGPVQAPLVQTRGVATLQEEGMVLTQEDMVMPTAQTTQAGVVALATAEETEEDTDERSINPWGNSPSRMYLSYSLWNLWMGADCPRILLRA